MTICNERLQRSEIESLLFYFMLLREFAIFIDRAIRSFCSRRVERQSPRSERKSSAIKFDDYFEGGHGNLDLRSDEIRYVDRFAPNENASFQVARRSMSSICVLLR